MELKEQGQFGKPDPGLFGKCESCGRPIAIGLARCIYCKRRTGLNRAENSSRALSLGLLLLLLLLVALGAWGYRRLTERRQRASVAQAGETFSEQTDDRIGVDSGRRLPSAPAQQALDPSAPRVHRSPEPRQVTMLTPGQTPTRAAPTLTTETIACPACRGNGRLSYPAPRTGTYTCPVCTGAGNRTRRFLTDKWKLCGACKGMGAVAKEDKLFRTRNLIVKETCKTCMGKGLVAVE